MLVRFNEYDIAEETGEHIDNVIRDMAHRGLGVLDSYTLETGEYVVSFGGNRMTTQELNAIVRGLYRTPSNKELNRLATNAHRDDYYPPTLQQLNAMAQLAAQENRYHESRTAI